ncbi:hypothetical protein RDWZM_007040 [Blomia tropicalis]|uniref:Protein SYS1 homolog n=1 Tax=Blomia tropicalis TaxID=40697 RepID=A0A9Q0RMB7_BLOTA|nr:Integral membrane protein of the Golgi [Blomia tropicalis]KAJ6221228.1 hypothetical protein RDWZM_007040 [Blomia tropicalis]
MSGNFRYTRWDPVLISSQIVAIQSTFYVTFGLIALLFSTLFGHYPSLDIILNFQVISFRTSMGILTILCTILNSVAGSLILFNVIQRAKPCLDFTLTTYLIHLLCVWMYNGQFPFSFLWWTLNVVAITIMCVCGEFLCLKSEMKSIPLLVSSHTSSL